MLSLNAVVTPINGQYIPRTYGNLTSLLDPYSFLPKNPNDFTSVADPDLVLNPWSLTHFKGTSDLTKIACVFTIDGDSSYNFE